jgi:hypothetical protein
MLDPFVQSEILDSEFLMVSVVLYSAVGKPLEVDQP